MTNGGLEQAGIKYVIDVSTVNGAVTNINTGLSRIEQSQKKVTAGAKSFDEAVGANGRSMRIFAGNALDMAGASGVTSRALEGTLSATNLLSLGLVGATAIIGITKQALDDESKTLRDHQQELANTSDSYAEFIRKRSELAGTPEGLAGSLQSSLGIATTSLFDSMKDSGANAFADALDAIIGGGITRWHPDPLLGAQLINKIYSYATNPAGALIEEIIPGAIQRGMSAFQEQQGEEATTQFLAAAAAREHARSLQEQLAKMVAAGATTDALIIKLHELNVAQRAVSVGAGRIDTGAGLEGQAAALQSRQARGGEGAIKGLQFLNPFADKYAQQFLDAQAQFQEQSTATYADYNERLAQIESDAGERRGEIARQYGERIAEIDADLGRRRTDAAAELAQHIADAEANAQEQRAKAAQKYQERLAEIEQQFSERRQQIAQDYQDNVKRINEQYATSYFDAASRNDAKGLVQARLTRDQQLKEAAQTRDRQNEDAAKQHAKDLEQARKAQADTQKQIAEALAQQREQYQKDEQRRLEQLDKQAQLEKEQAAKAQAEQLRQVESALAKEYSAENFNLAKRLAAVDKNFSDRKKKIVESMSAEQGLTDQYARAILNSMKGILNADEIADLIKRFDEQLKARIDISVTPFKKEGTASKLLGGFDAVGRLTQLHPGEWVIPNLNSVGASRFNEVMGGMQQYYGSRSMPYSGSNTSTSSRNGSATVRISLDSGMLHGVVTDVAGDVVIQVLEEAERVASR